MDRTWKIHIAFAAFAAHWGLLLTVQAGSFCAYLLPAGSDPQDALGYLSTIPFIQGQNIVAAGLLGLLAFVLAGRRIARWFILPIHLLAAIVVLIDQIFYKISFDHLRPSLFEVSRTWNPGVALSSLGREIDTVFYIAAAIALAGELWLIRALAKPPRSATRWQPFAWAAALLLVVGMPAFTSSHYFHLNEHVLITATRDGSTASLSTSLGRRKVLAAPSDPPVVDRSPELARLLDSGRRRARRPNVVMVVIESVGARNLLTADGLPSPVYAPNLARLAKHSAIFDSMYVPAPATARSMVALHTGGRVVTESGPPELLYRFQGPMLGRSLQQLGYRTALFSSERLDVEGCDSFLEQVGYDRFQAFENDVASRFPENLIHSWGAREEYTLGLIDQWLDQAGGDRPFYLEYMNAATHHPYGAPPGYRVPFPAKDDRSQYFNAIHYTDRAIGLLLDMLERKGVLQDTVIVVTGDHGEAFGDPHRANFLHKYFIYEENIRGFLMLSDPQWKLEEPLRSARICSNGDVMPTLLNYINAPDDSLPGRNLLAEFFPLRNVYFYKNAQPEKWGLRDGKWKFIGEIRTAKAELYDLSADPLEQNNLAATDRARVERYAAQCEEWFIRSDAEFVARLADYHPLGGRKIRPAEYSTPGPKLQSTGTRERGAFTESTRFTANQLPTVWNHWVLDGATHAVTFRWLAPSGAEFFSTFEQNPDWDYTYAAFPGVLPLEKGRWKVTMVTPYSPGLATSFTVN